MEELRIAESAAELVGKTPLLRASRFAAAAGLHTAPLLKLEYLNPTGSAKDRAALRMLEAAEAAGRLAPGATIIEPTSGNTGIALAALCVCAWLGWRDGGQWWWIGTGLLLVAGAGWWDDHRPLSAALRLGVHAAAAAAMALTARSIGGGPVEMAMAFCAAIILVNVWNFMDGIDGLATTQAMIVALCALGLASSAGMAALLALFVLAGCAGFLPWNFPKARIFLGDAGSGALGYAIAGLLVALAAQGREKAEWLLVPMAAFLVDAACTLLSRILKRERWWTAHSQHLYQALARRRGAHVPVTTAYAIYAIGCMAFTWPLSSLGGTAAPVATCVVYTVTAMLWWRIRRGALRY